MQDFCLASFRFSGSFNFIFPLNSGMECESKCWLVVAVHFVSRPDMTLCGWLGVDHIKHLSTNGAMFLCWRNRNDAFKLEPVEKPHTKTEEEGKGRGGGGGGKKQGLFFFKKGEGRPYQSGLRKWYQQALHFFTNEWAVKWRIKFRVIYFGLFFHPKTKPDQSAARKRRHLSASVWVEM